MSALVFPFVASTLMADVLDLTELQIWIEWFVGALLLGSLNGSTQCLGQNCESFPLISLQGRADFIPALLLPQRIN